jgi:hypothetical protein
LQRAANAPDRDRAVAFEFMFPNAHNAPAHFAQRAIHPPIAFHVARDLRSPVRSILDRHAQMLATAVPEAAIDEHRNRWFRRRQVRSTRYCRPAPKPGNAMRTQQTPQAHFRGAVSRSAHRRHDPRSLSLRDGIAHSA